MNAFNIPKLVVCVAVKSEFHLTWSQSPNIHVHVHFGGTWPDLYAGTYTRCFDMEKTSLLRNGKLIILSEKQN